MKQICEKACGLFGCSAVILGGIVAVSAFALAAALTSEVVLGLEPCILCIYQRIPFVVAIILGLTGLFLRKNDKVTALITLLCGVAFLVNAGIAFYHTGVELHWWHSAVEGCTVNFGDDTPQSVLENILSAPTARCDEIAWSDPLLGLSMANYNLVLCLGLFVACMLSLATRQCRKGSTFP